MSKLDLVFLGSSAFVVPILDSITKNSGRTVREVAKEQLLDISTKLSINPNDLDNPLLDQPIELKLVISQPDRPLRRKLVSNPVSEYARKNNLNLFTPESLNREFANNSGLAEGFDLGIVASFGQIISPTVLDLARLGFLNWHPSKLPQYRGATPMQTALRDGRTQTALSWIEMTKEMDAGDVWWQIDQEINREEVFVDLAKRMGVLGSQTWALVVALKLLAQIRPEFLAQPQDPNRATYCGRLTKEDALIDPNQMSAQEVFNHWRAYQEFPGTKLYDDYFGQLIKLTKLSDYLTYTDLNSLAEEAVYQNHRWIQTKTANGLKTYLQNGSGFVLVDQITLENGKTINFRGYRFS
jgi:methionyl-tRNA formyltransferase